MDRRFWGEESGEIRRDLRALIQQLEQGSNHAESQVVALLARAEIDPAPVADKPVETLRSASRQTQTAQTQNDGSDQSGPPPAQQTNRETTQAVILNELATSAANGSPYSLEVLLSAIGTYDLAGPAIGRVIQNPEHVKDIQQDVLVNVARSIHRYRSESKFTTWLYTVARNIAVNHARKLRSTLDLGTDDTLNDNARRRMSSLVAERDTVKEAIATLPAEFRTTVVLRDLEGLSYAEIAERQGLQINTVRSRLARGRALLAERLR